MPQFVGHPVRHFAFKLAPLRSQVTFQRIANARVIAMSKAVACKSFQCTTGARTVAAGDSSRMA